MMERFGGDLKQASRGEQTQERVHRETRGESMSGPDIRRRPEVGNHSIGETRYNE
jgi:hypothetical protein